MLKTGGPNIDSGGYNFRLDVLCIIITGLLSSVGHIPIYKFY